MSAGGDAVDKSQMSALRPARPPVRSYSTRFELDETPISEGGNWLNGRTDGSDWCDVVTRAGHAYGEVTRMAAAEHRAEQGNLAPQADAPAGDYDDPTAVLAGPWGRNQFARATVFSMNPTDKYFQEVEIRLRSTITPHSCTGYEVFFRCLKTNDAYAEIVRWNGKIGDFTSLARRVGPEFGVRDGDVIEACVIGNDLKGFINGVEVISAADDRFSTGGPGVGFNFFVGDTNVDHGLSSFEVDTYDD
jgi:hypothetical protein